jgi:hypothetical protein
LDPPINESMHLSLDGQSALAVTTDSPDRQSGDRHPRRRTGPPDGARVPLRGAALRSGAEAISGRREWLLDRAASGRSPIPFVCCHIFGFLVAPFAAAHDLLDGPFADRVRILG